MSGSKRLDKKLIFSLVFMAGLAKKKKKKNKDKRQRLALNVLIA